MNKEIILLLIIYFAAINLIAVFATFLDKILAKAHRRRISEKALLTFAALGGSFGEYFMMKIIRHKTQHKKFMLSLPAMMIFHLLLFGVLLYLLNPAA